ncbi:gamma-interferon-responsive lysosomal thiol protein-like [Physcomitrium patens]|uniref:gamma-interferon-responsive lysosomal thiol protein-like n=1 Tax=Physcomitrium patens TaxID=3218 RepID=UPI003CCD28AC
MDHASKCAFTFSKSICDVGAEKVKFELYSETLCPCCAYFIIKVVNPFFNNGLIDIMELCIVPFHGLEECKLNIIQTCAIQLWPKVVRFPINMLSSGVTVVVATLR